MTSHVRVGGSVREVDKVSAKIGGSWKDMDSVHTRVGGVWEDVFFYGIEAMFCVDNTGDELWRINPADPGDVSGDYGLVGALPSGLTGPGGLAFRPSDREIFCVSFTHMMVSLWRINPADPGDVSGDYGLVGALPSGLTGPQGIAFRPSDEDMFCVTATDAQDELWRINPADPGDVSGDYGLVGALPSGLTFPQGLEFRPSDESLFCGDAGGADELWRINPADPGDVSGDYGLVGALPSGLEYGSGLSFSPSDEATMFCVDNTGDELWRINPADPGDVSGDYGLVGALPSGLTGPLGLVFRRIAVNS